MGDLGDQLTQAKITLSQLSTYAKSVGDLPTMYAVNRAWHQLDAADRDLQKRRLALTNGESRE
jgi:hypothetical protein